MLFFLCFVITCVAVRCRKAKRTSRDLAVTGSVSSSTALTSIQQPFLDPSQAQFQSNSASLYTPAGTYPPPTVDFASLSAHVTMYLSQPPPPYSYPAESPPPYPGEECAPQNPPQGNLYPWEYQNQENSGSHTPSQPSSL